MNAAPLPRQVREAGRSAGSTTTLERNDIGCAARDRFVIAMEKAIEPVSGARNAYDQRGLRVFIETKWRGGRWWRGRPCGDNEMAVAMARPPFTSATKSMTLSWRYLLPALERMLAPK